MTWDVFGTSTLEPESVVAAGLGRVDFHVTYSGFDLKKCAAFLHLVRHGNAPM